MHEATIRYVLLALGSIVIIGILLNELRRNKRERINEPLEKKVKDEKMVDEKDLVEELLEHIEKMHLGDEVLEIREDEPILDEEVLEDLSTFHKEEVIPEKNDKDIISIYIMAKSGQSFGGYDLLQTILANDMQYGDMQIFHRYADSTTKTNLLFSLVSATEPGDFNLQEIGAFSCKGLILFMKIPEVDKSLQAFNSMLKTAKSLAEDLDGELKIDQECELTEKIVEEIKASLKK